MKVVDKKSKAHSLQIDGVLEVHNGVLCVVEFDGEGDVTRAIPLHLILEKRELLGVDVKVKVDEPTEKEETELSLD